MALFLICLIYLNSIMKKLFFALFIIIGIGAITSCKKYTRKKISNSWIVESYSIERTIDYSDGSKIITNTEGSGSNYNYTATTFDSIGSIVSVIDRTSEIIENYRVYNKDGSLETIFQTRSSQISGDSTIVDEFRRVRTGTWSFIGKDELGDFKKNERIIQTILTVTDSHIRTTTHNNGGTPRIETDNSSSVHTSGTDIRTFLIADANKKSLVLIQKTSSNTGSAGFNVTYDETFNMVPAN